MLFNLSERFQFRVYFFRQFHFHELFSLLQNFKAFGRLRITRIYFCFLDCSRSERKCVELSCSAENNRKIYKRWRLSFQQLVKVDR